MGIQDLGVLESFQCSRRYYIVCTSVVVLLNFFCICRLLSPKHSQRASKFNKIFLFSLALSDLLYEATTTILFLQSNSADSGENSKTLYFIYLGLNLCTVFHIVVLIVEKVVADFVRKSHHFNSSVFWSIFSWSSAFGLAYIDLQNGGGFLGEDSMAFLGRFKAFGYFVFTVLFFSVMLVILLTFCLAQPYSKNILEKSQSLEASESGMRSESLSMQDMLFSSLCMATYVGWCAWVILGVDCGIMRSIEIMKSFEVTRLGARILHPLVSLCPQPSPQPQKAKYFAMREPWANEEYFVFCIAVCLSD